MVDAVRTFATSASRGIKITDVLVLVGDGTGKDEKYLGKSRAIVLEDPLVGDVSRDDGFAGEDISPLPYSKDMFLSIGDDRYGCGSVSACLVRISDK